MTMEAGTRGELGGSPKRQQQPHQQQKQQQQHPKGKNMEDQDYILLTPYPVEPGHTLITILRTGAADFRPEMAANAAYVAAGDNAGIIINKKANIMDYNRAQASQKERLQPPNAKMSFKVFLINSETNLLTLEHRTLRFWLAAGDQMMGSSSNNNNNNNSSCSMSNSNDSGLDGQTSSSGNRRTDERQRARSLANMKLEGSQLAQAYFCQLIGTKHDDFPKLYVNFIMKLMRLLKTNQFRRIVKMEVELRQLAQEDQQSVAELHSRASDGPNGSGTGGAHGDGRGSPLTSQKVLDIIESSYPNPVSIREICSSTRTDEATVRQFVDELAQKEKINSTDDGQNFTRTTKPIDSKVNLVRQMPKVTKSQQPVIAILTSQYCEKLAVDSMISDKETFVRYHRTATTTSSQSDGGGQELSSANYVYTLGNIGDHRVVSTKLTAIGSSRALIAAGSATTRLLGTFPELEYVFLVGCAGAIPNYTDFSSHVRLGDVVVSHLPAPSAGTESPTSSEGLNGLGKLNEHVYVHCRPKKQEEAQAGSGGDRPRGLPVSYSVHKNLKRAASGPNGLQAQDFRRPSAPVELLQQQLDQADNPPQAPEDEKPLEYEDCHFRLWRPPRLDLQELAQRLWLQGLENPKHRIWEYYIDEGIKTLRQQQDLEASRPPADTDKLFMSIGSKDTIEVNHPEAAEDEIDLRRHGRPMCHFGPIGSGGPALANESLKQSMISEFGLKAFDSEFYPVVESICGNCKECYIMIRGVSDYRDGRKKKEWQQYSALAAAAFMKSIIVNLKPLD